MRQRRVVFAILCTGKVHFLGADRKGRSAIPSSISSCLFRRHPPKCSRRATLCLFGYRSSLVDQSSAIFETVFFIERQQQVPQFLPASGIEESKAVSRGSASRLIDPRNTTSQVSFLVQSQLERNRSFNMSIKLGYFGKFMQVIH